MEATLIFAFMAIAVSGSPPPRGLHPRDLTSEEILWGFSLPAAETSDVSIDVLLQKANPKEGAVDQHRAVAGAGVVNENLRWTDNIMPYKISSDFDDVDVSFIYSGMKEWMEKTCIRFEPYSEELARKLGHKNHLNIHSGNGCWSMVGMERTGAQGLSLSIYGCMSHQLSLHELGHAIGLHHEQCREDRDQYLQIVWPNISPEMKYNFRRQTDTSNFSTPYDYCSIMHYGAWSMGMNKYPTMVPKDKDYLLTMGKSMHLSFSDEQTVNLMYNCAAKCPADKTAACAKPCFLNHKCECRCPDHKCELRKLAETCQDDHPRCLEFAKAGECNKNPGWMNQYCGEACGICGTIDKIVEDPLGGNGRCNDYHPTCAEWSKRGECEKNPWWMVQACTKSCGLCDGECRDEEPNCESRAKANECEFNPEVLKKCKKSCKLCKSNEDEDEDEDEGPDIAKCSDKDANCVERKSRGECWDNNIKNRENMYLTCPKSCGLCKGDCKDIHVPKPRSNCEMWANQGHCKRNPTYMLYMCKKSCGLC